MAVGIVVAAVGSAVLEFTDYRIECFYAIYRLDREVASFLIEPEPPEPKKRFYQLGIITGKWLSHPRSNPRVWLEPRWGQAAE